MVLIIPTHSVGTSNELSFRPAGRLVWIQEVEQCRELLPRNLTPIECIKISPADRNDSSLRTLKQLGMTYSNVEPVFY